MAKEIVYLGRDNGIDFQLQDDSATPGTKANTDLTNATKVGIVLDVGTDNTPQEFYSDTDPDVVQFTPGGIVSLYLGTVLSEAREYVGEIVVYSNQNDDGVAWQPKLKIVAVESVPPI